MMMPLELQSFERTEDPRAFAAGLGRLTDQQAPGFWAHVKPSVFGRSGEAHITLTGAGEVVGISRADFAGDIMRRALVIAPGFQHSAESLELSRRELAAFFGRGVREVEYMIQASHAVARGRILLLGGEQRGGVDGIGYETYRLPVEVFEARQLALAATLKERTK